MKFTELDAKMRVYETAHDTFVLPGVYIVARLDGRSFTRLTKEIHKFKAPFDEAFRDYMAETVRHLMNCGFKIVYGFTESDEISLLFDLNENSFSRKRRKINSILAGEASAKFSSLLGSPAAFDCRLCELPNKGVVIDYFRWRNEDAHRNALNAYCYWRLRQDNYTIAQATNWLQGKSIAEKNELLFTYDINFNNLPNWQKRGIGFYWSELQREGFNPKTQQTTFATRKQIAVEYNLPMKDNYDAFISDLLE